MTAVRRPARHQELDRSVRLEALPRLQAVAAERAMLERVEVVLQPRLSRLRRITQVRIQAVALKAAPPLEAPPAAQLRLRPMPSMVLMKHFSSVSDYHCSPLLE